jgi:predicted transcriptional regulator of viral defense system
MGVDAPFVHNTPRFLKDCVFPTHHEKRRGYSSPKLWSKAAISPRSKQRKQATDYSHLDYHVRSGKFERVEHGLYRIRSLPLGEQDDLVRLTFWSRNRQDEPQAIVSHESALVVHDLSEILPGKIHLTVPLKFRKEPPAGCILHKATLNPTDIEDHAGFGVTTPLRTLLDVASNGVPQEQLEKAVAEALTRGLVRESNLIEAARTSPRSQHLLRVLNDKLPKPKDKVG